MSANSPTHDKFAIGPSSPAEGDRLSTTAVVSPPTTPRTPTPYSTSREDSKSVDQRRGTAPVNTRPREGTNPLGSEDQLGYAVKKQNGSWVIHTRNGELLQVDEVREEKTEQK